MVSLLFSLLTLTSAFSAEELLYMRLKEGQTNSAAIVGRPDRLVKDEQGLFIQHGSTSERIKLKLKSDGSYVGENKTVKYLVKPNSDFSEIYYSYSYKKENSGGGSSYYTQRIFILAPCVNYAGKQYCTGEHVAMPWEEHVNGKHSGDLGSFITDSNGQLVLFEVVKGAQRYPVRFKISYLPTVQKSNPNIRCSHDICIGDVKEFYDDDGFTEGKVIGFTPMGITMEVTKGKFPWWSQGEWKTAYAVHTGGEKQPFSKIDSRSCNNISVNEQDRLYKAAASEAKRSCEKNSGVDLCVSFKYRNEWGYVYGYRSTSDGRCEFLGYLKPAVKSPLN
jgi:hypothetical protein